MRTVWDVSTSLDCFPERLRQVRASVPIPSKGEVVRAIQRMLDALVHEPRTLIVDTAALVSNFNALLQQVKEQFRGADTLRLIEPLGVDASVALVAVRLSIVKRTIDAELARATEEAS
jgi:hypothetical protein